MSSLDDSEAGSSYGGGDEDNDGVRTPLLSHRRLFSTLRKGFKRSSSSSSINRKRGNSCPNDSYSLEASSNGIIQNETRTSDNARRLETFSGVFTPVCLSMFSALLFLRIGFIVGQAGILEVLAQFLLAYTILLCTVLSICAISTNGAIEGGGAYYMISRTLGPEFGGSIGTLFFLANIFSSALYITGCVEGFVDNFGPEGFLVDGAVPSGRWWSFLYASIVALFNLFVCLIGASMFARTNVIIFAVVMTCTVSVAVSFLAQSHIIEVPLPSANSLIGNMTTANYTGFSWETFQENVWPHYGVDYTTMSMVDFATVFGVLFSGVTGIMAGANMSGELKEPRRSIPWGTLSAVAFTFIVYLILTFFTAATCSNELLRNNYIFMQYINMVKFFVPVGIFAATLSASLSNLIGASRVLIAVAKDELFGIFLKPIARGVWKDNPVASVIFSWFLVQLILLIGTLNLIAQVTAVFFLLSYCATNLACLALQLTSAPNFRPSFKYVSWPTCLVGLIGTLTMMFVINAAYAGICLVVCLLLVIVLHLRSLPVQWGSISQALIFHQVRKYLLMLDSRKEHVKFWRPQMLLMVANPRSSIALIDFVNDLKKSGLYVIGHVKKEEKFNWDADPVAEDLPVWLSLIDELKVKAFVETTSASSVREGLRHLIRISGLGAMKPNTIIFGFYDNDEPIDFLKMKMDAKRSLAASPTDTELGPVSLTNQRSFPDLRQLGDDRDVEALEYVGMIDDAIRMQKNVCLCRNFSVLDKMKILKAKRSCYIDIWPMNILNPTSASDFSNNTTLFLLQLACILHMVPGWKSKTTLRIFTCSRTTDDDISLRQKQLKSMLRELRISARIINVLWDHVYNVIPHQESQQSTNHSFSDLPVDYITGYNELIREHCTHTAVLFTYLSAPPTDDDNKLRYLSMLDDLSKDLPPIVFVYGVNPVISTTL
ncbi:hypothetical protein CHUAL_000149 [Chamberlinius hualienensis]